MEEIIPPSAPKFNVAPPHLEVCVGGEWPVQVNIEVGGRGISFFDNAFKFMSDEASLGRFNQPPTLAFAVEAYGEVGIISSIYR